MRCFLQTRWLGPAGAWPFLWMSFEDVGASALAALAGRPDHGLSGPIDLNGPVDSTKPECGCWVANHYSGWGLNHHRTARYPMRHAS
jgi:hypothetical protein